MSCFNKSKDFSTLVINIDHLRSKIYDINPVITSKLFDIIILLETKLDEETPNDFFSFCDRSYNLIRRDRNSDGGGILVLCRKEYKILKKEVSMDAEIIYLQILNKNTICNFLACYKNLGERMIDQLSYKDF